jgi:hypothetical protein
LSNYLEHRINKTKYKNTKPANKVKPRRKIVIGFDSEADTSARGTPMMFQFSLPNTAEEDTLVYTLPDKPYAGLRCILDFLDENCQRSGIEYLIYVWNLSYELTQLFRDLPIFIKDASEFVIRNISNTDGVTYDWEVHVSNNKRQMVEYRNGKVKVTMLDGMAFYKTSLDRAAKMLYLGEKKELANLSRTLFTRDDLESTEFIEYAKRDAFITRKVGEYIQHLHSLYEIPTTISAPHFSAVVFRTQFLNEPINPPSPDLEQAGLYSYHGGKNGFYIKEPTTFQVVYNYDIVSAYPEAMRQLPDIEKGIWRPVAKYIPGVHGLYQVDIDYEPCLWRSLQIHDGSWLEKGRINGIWTTSYELDSLLEKGEGRLRSCRGYVFDGPEGGPLVRYVDKFFGIKRTTSGPERETAKLFLNSLYGKFFQKQALDTIGAYDINTGEWVESNPAYEYDYDAGGLYNPPIASLITGFVRAKIHRLEHRYNSLMTSTDGFFGTVAPEPQDLSDNLGGLTALAGKLRIWRERLYIFDGYDGKQKYALHGFHAGVSQLSKIPLQRGSYTYKGKQLVTLKMSTREMDGSLHSAGEFVELPFTLHL